MNSIESVKIFKIGGNVVDNPNALNKFIADFATVKGAKILVHGGGKEATRLSERLGIPTKMIDGRRVTDRETIDVVTMVYAGLVNKRIVALLQANQVDAIGLSGADGNAIRAVKRSPIPTDYGYVGDINPDAINIRFIVNNLLSNNISPVFCAIMHNGEGTLLNCNADSVASALAVACAQSGINVELIYCFEKDGVLRDIDDATSIISKITPETYLDLRTTGVISKGMIPKIENALSAIEKGVKSVVIKNSNNITNNIGTVITSEK